jgi:hypothetical protein
VQADYAKPLAETQTGRLFRALNGSVPSCYRDPQRTTALRGRAGWEIVGRDHLGRGSVQNETHASKTASMSGDDGWAIEDLDNPSLSCQAMHHPALTRPLNAGSTTPAVHLGDDQWKHDLSTHLTVCMGNTTRAYQPLREDQEGAPEMQIISAGATASPIRPIRERSAPVASAPVNRPRVEGPPGQTHR